MIEIRSVSNPYIKSLVALRRKNERDEQGLFLVEGYHLVEAAYQAQCLQEIIVVDPALAVFDVKTTQVTREIIEKVTHTTTPQDIVGVCKKQPLPFQIYDRSLLLDDVSDPGNLGTLIRTAVAFGVQCIYCSPHCVDVYNEKVIRATQGALFSIPIFYIDLQTIIKDLKKQSITLIGTDLKSETTLETCGPISKYAVLLGNESRGINEALLQQTNINVKIPISDQIDSLNVAIAGAIILYHLK